MQANSLPAEPQGKPKNIGVGSLSLLQWIFQTQELNQGLLHCRQILYQLSYEGSPTMQWSVVLKLEMCSDGQAVCWFPMAAVTNYHKLDVLKQQERLP